MSIGGSGNFDPQWETKDGGTRSIFQTRNSETGTVEPGLALAGKGGLGDYLEQAAAQEPEEPTRQEIAAGRMQEMWDYAQAQREQQQLLQQQFFNPWSF